MNNGDQSDGPARGPFACRRCGQCCRGEGGIVVSNKDLDRLCRYLGMGAAVFETRYGRRSFGKLKVRIGADENCIFFREGEGCTVHPARPDICRAWPYFRGNLVDEQSHALAAQYCPGLDKQQPHEEFLQEGLRYLQSEGLCGRNGPDEAAALQVDDLAAADGKG